MIPPRLARSMVFVGGLAASLAAWPSTELRALWVDGFHPGFRNDTEVRRLISDARNAGFNTLFVEVRRRGDVFYDSPFEPMAEEVAPGFDPLQRILELAHDATAGPRLAVHAWLVAYNVWSSRTNLPAQGHHPFRRHPEWLTRNRDGATWDGHNFAFDPGHPAVQQYTFDIALDLIRRYDLDGLHWDYIRYAGKDWGYHREAVARFNRRFGRSGLPAVGDADWLQFRRDQVTALVRKVWLSSFAEKPGLALSAATIAFAPGITNLAQWPTSAAYSDVLQDWRGWLEEGILDLNVPMVYFRQEERPASFAAWTTFLVDHTYGRRAAVGVGCFLNEVSVALDQIRRARATTPAGNAPAGIAVYSYAQPSRDTNQVGFLSALTAPSPLDPEGPPIFAEPAAAPDLSWKTGSPTGHVRGSVRHASTLDAFDDASVQLSGPVRRLVRSDGTGFFGAVDLPPGDYSAVVTARGFEAATADFTVRASDVARLDFDLVRTEPAAAR